MTYGWSILVVAVVLGALAYLGVFNPLYFAPKANPGSCQVFRPNGAGTSYDINLLGVCSNEIPKYAATFNGKDSLVNFGNGAMLSPEAGANGAMTFCMWYRVNSYTGYAGPMIKGELSLSNGNSWEYTMDQGGGIEGFTVWNQGGGNIATASSDYFSYADLQGKWVFACFTYNYAAGSADYYVGYSSLGYSNLLQFSSGVANGPATAGTGNFVVGGGEGGYSAVSIADMQMYNSSLDYPSVNALYQEGIGGVPIDLHNLVGWWPLNGNANDYSGNGNNGVPTNILFANSWMSGYSAP